jgi:hypothetical protein
MMPLHRILHGAFFSLFAVSYVVLLSYSYERDVRFFIIMSSQQPCDSRFCRVSEKYLVHSYQNTNGHGQSCNDLTVVIRIGMYM